MQKYDVIAENKRYTIGIYDKDYDGYIVNDGICNYYWWELKKEAKAAADALNKWEKQGYSHYLGSHLYGHDKIYKYRDGTYEVGAEIHYFEGEDQFTDDYIALYEIFGIVQEVSAEQEEEYKESIGEEEYKARLCE